MPNHSTNASPPHRGWGTGPRESPSQGSVGTKSTLMFPERTFASRRWPSTTARVTRPCSNVGMRLDIQSRRTTSSSCDVCPARQAAGSLRPIWAHAIDHVRGGVDEGPRLPLALTDEVPKPALACCCSVGSWKSSSTPVQSSLRQPRNPGRTALHGRLVVIFDMSTGVVFREGQRYVPSPGLARRALGPLPRLLIKDGEKLPRGHVPRRPGPSTWSAVRQIVR